MNEEAIPFNGQTYELLYYKQLSGYVEHITPPRLLICSNYTKSEDMPTLLLKINLAWQFMSCTFALELQQQHKKRMR